MKTIGNYEARTHWSAMLQDVKAGERYVILHKGQPIAELVSAKKDSKLIKSKRAAERLLQLISSRPQIDVDLKALLNEGRD